MSELMAHVIDDDEDVRDLIAFLLSTSDIPFETYPSAKAFLAVASEAKGVVVTDVRMPQMDGLELIRLLTVRGVNLPVIVMTGHGDVPLAVEAMKAGAIDFIEKPFDDVAMLVAIRAALARQEDVDTAERERKEFQKRIERLSPRERQVLDGLIVGRPNKLIAYDLDISARTVEIYRAHIMVKMQARSLSALVRMAMLAGLG